MPTVHVVVDFWQPSYHGVGDGGRAEWPPSPLRLAQALLAGAHRPSFDPAAREAVETLVRLPNPVIRVPDSQVVELPPTYTHRSGTPETTSNGRATPGKLGGFLDTHLVGLAAGNLTSKTTDSVWLDDCRVVYSVQDPERSLDVSALSRAARRVPYFGRSQDGCDVTVTLDEVPGPTIELHPREHPQGDARCGIRGWRHDSCAWMDHNHKLMGSGSAIQSLSRTVTTRWLSYVPGSMGRPSMAQRRVRTFSLKRSVPGASAPHVLAALPAVPGIVRFPCLNIGTRRADGRLHGVGIVLPEAGSPEAGSTDEYVSAITQAELVDTERTAQLATLRFEKWERSSVVWQSASPFRSHPDDRIARLGLEQELAQRFGQPPVEVMLSRRPFQPWQRRWRQPPDGLDQWWATFGFATSVPGPFLLGATTAEGFGLFAPIEEDG